MPKERPRNIPQQFMEDMDLNVTQQKPVIQPPSTPKQPVVHEQELIEVKPDFFCQNGCEKQLKKAYKNQLKLDARLDCHGMTAQECFENVRTFLDHAYSEQYRLVLLIHGVGQGILKNTIQNYLHFAPKIIGFCQAPPILGGYGATLALIKKHQGQYK